MDDGIGALDLLEWIDHDFDLAEGISYEDRQMVSSCRMALESEEPIDDLGERIVRELNEMSGDMGEYTSRLVVRYFILDFERTRASVDKYIQKADDSIPNSTQYCAYVERAQNLIKRAGLDAAVFDHISLDVVGRAIVSNISRQIDEYTMQVGIMHEFPSIHRKLFPLHRELDRAIHFERYEDAAELRDEIKSLIPSDYYPN